MSVLIPRPYMQDGLRPEVMAPHTTQRVICAAVITCVMPTPIVRKRVAWSWSEFASAQNRLGSVQPNPWRDILWKSEVLGLGGGGGGRGGGRGCVSLLDWRAFTRAVYSRGTPVRLLGGGEGGGREGGGGLWGLW